MLDHLGRKKVAGGEYIFRSGDEGDCAYIIESGVFEVIAPLGDQVVAFLGEGELFGEIALLDQHPRTASVRALQDATLIEVKRETVAELLDQADPIIRHLLLIVLGRFRSSAAAACISTAGANRPTMADPHGIKLQATERLTLMEDLDYALKSGQLVLFYQPILRLADRSLAGFEALMRWQHPKIGLVAPNNFLPLAEETGQIRQIGLWSIEQACRDWHELKTITTGDRVFMSINVSAKQLTHEHFSEHVAEILNRMGTDPHEIKLELTETTIIRNPDLAKRLLQHLADLGCSIALDDYGTGYSGLEHLKTYPFNTLKLDQSFIRDILGTRVILQLVRSSIDMSKSLKLGLVAEGVENEEIALMLGELGCDYAQGYLFAKPMRKEELLAKYSRQR